MNGWVCNVRDGCVEAVLHGPEVAVRALVERARQGPSAVRVEAVEASECEGVFPASGRGSRTEPTPSPLVPRCRGAYQRRLENLSTRKSSKVLTAGDKCLREGYSAWMVMSGGLQSGSTA